MTQQPPDLEAYEAEVRRRVEASNYAPAGASSNAPGGVSGAEEQVKPQTVTTAGSANPARNARSTVTLALAVGTILSLLMVAFLVVPLMVDKAKGLSPQDVEDVIAEGPPFADSLTATQMYDAYISMNRNGRIYRIIPNTDDGRRYFRAFMYSVTDLKLVESFAGEMTAEQASELAERELHFLALEDLDYDLDITHTDGTREILNGLPPDGD